MLDNINFSAIKCEGDNGPKVLVTVWADVADWEAITIADDAALGALLVDEAIAAIEGGQ
jgi:hypothetical protein